MCLFTPLPPSLFTRHFPKEPLAYVSGRRLTLEKSAVPQVPGDSVAGEGDIG